MGDRANFGFRKDSDSPVLFLYGHWAGAGMMETLATALHAVQQYGRLTDDGYATRIAISRIVAEEWRQEYGWGIYIDELGDNEHSIPVVNWADQTVTLYGWNSVDRFPCYADNVKFAMPIDDFILRFSKVGAR